MMGERDDALRLVAYAKASAPPATTPDQIRTIGLIEIAPHVIEGVNRFKHRSADGTPPKEVQAAMVASRFLAPLVVDTQLRLIDGAARLYVALKHKLERIWVTVVDATAQQADYLALALNKSAQYQRWRWDEIDEWLEASSYEHIATLEPLGLFGERIIPSSYMGDGMTRYRIDADYGVVSKQQDYRQEPGFAEWAREATRLRNEEKERKAYAKRVGAPIHRAAPPVLSPMPAAGAETAIPTAKLKVRKRFKREGWQHRKALKRSMGITGFVTPIVATRDGTVIDGALRVQLAQELHEEGWWPSATVPVIFLAAIESTVDLLRILLNRTSEFQRWQHEAVDGFIDTHPHLRPLYEPFGVWTSELLPESAWGSTALRFEQSFQRQTFDPAATSLREWGEQQRLRQLVEEQERAVSPLKPPGSYTSVFELPWDASALLPVHSPHATAQEVVSALLTAAPLYQSLKD